MNEVWRIIPEFPNYSVSDLGRVRNDEMGYIMTQLRNQHGVVHVGLTRNLVQYRRSVALIVASAFVPKLNEHFDTPIHLDGDRFNSEVENLMWRPKWFAARYHQQFKNGERGFKVPVLDTKTGERFKTSWEAALKYGLIDREILVATTNRTYVWPTYQVFRVI